MNPISGTINTAHALEQPLGSNAMGTPETAPGGGAQSLPSGAPDAPADAPPSAMPWVPVGAAEEMLAMRCNQVRRFGHTPAADLALPFDHFARDLESRARGLREGAQFNQYPAVQRQRLIKLGALAMAMVDWLDAQPLSQTEPSTP